jgi:hypothetical protein
VKTTIEYALVGAGSLFFGAAVLNFIWIWEETYPRFVPTAIAIPGCLIAFMWCLMKAGEIAVSKLPPLPKS